MHIYLTGRLLLKLMVWRQALFRAPNDNLQLDRCVQDFGMKWHLMIHHMTHSKWHLMGDHMTHSVLCLSRISQSISSTRTQMQNPNSKTSHILQSSTILPQGDLYYLRLHTCKFGVWMIVITYI